MVFPQPDLLSDLKIFDFRMTAVTTELKRQPKHLPCFFNKTIIIENFKTGRKSKLNLQSKELFGITFISMNLYQAFKIDSKFGKNEGY